jgi:long-chain acyl-CoA synthetase
VSQQLTQHPRHWARVAPDKPAIVFAGSGQVVTYRELSERADRCAQLLRHLGLQRGEHLAMLIENHPVFMEVAWAAQNSGLYYTPVSWRFKIDEIAYIVEDCGAKLVVATAQQADLVRELQRRLPAVRYLLAGAAVDGALDYDAALAAQPAVPIADESRGSDMGYSSGSTGRPKGVKQTLPTMSIDKPAAMFQVYERRYAWSPDTVYLLPAPLYHAGPLRFALAMHHLGATLIVMEHFDAAAALELCRRYRVTDAHLVPTMIVRILKLPQDIRAQAELGSLKRIIHGAAPIAPDIKRAMIAWVGPILEESYGGTEGNGLTMISSEEWLRHPGSVGRAFVGSIHILGDNGEELSPGEIGTVYFGGGPQFEYHGNPDKTRSAYDAKGRSTLGDIGYLDAEGYLYLTDRKHFMIISGGINIYPQEIENLLISHPQVLDAAVFGLPDPEMGEYIQAVVQPRDPSAAGPELANELMAYCRGRLANYKTPRSIDFRAHLPRHDTGKIYTRLVKDEYLALLG